MSQLFRKIRTRAGLKVGELASAMGRSRQTINRIEKGLQMPSLEQDAILIKKANVSRRGYVEAACEVLTEFLGQRVMIVPELRYRPTSPVEIGAELYNEQREKLNPALRERIEAKLHQGRVLEAITDQTTTLFKLEIRDLIKEALAARGEVLLEDGEA